MKKSLKSMLLEGISAVYEKSENSKLEDGIFKKLKKKLDFLSQYFKCTNVQALIVAIIFVENYKNKTTNYREIITHLKCNPLRLLEFSEDFDKLVEMEIVKKIYSRRGIKSHNTNFEDEFVINDYINKAILNSQHLTDEHIEKYIRERGKFVVQ